MKNHPLPLLLTFAAITLLVAACAGQGGAVATQRPLATPESLSISVSSTLEIPAILNPDLDPLPTGDIVSLLVTQAYAEVNAPTPNIPAAQATATAFADPFAGLTSNATPVPGGSGSGLVSTGSGVTSNLLVTPTAFAPAPAQVINARAITIPNAVNTATCTVQGVGLCTPTITAGNTVFMNWQFGVQGSQQFRWTRALIVITRDGGGFQTVPVADGRNPNPPDESKGEPWILNVGATAEFRAGIENIQPGYYTAQLRVCLLEPDECDLGRGWQDVGGDTIQFLVTQN